MKTEQSQCRFADLPGVLAGSPPLSHPSLTRQGDGIGSLNGDNYRTGNVITCKKTGKHGPTRN
jgi:hypothetical protein